MLPWSKSDMQATRRRYQAFATQLASDYNSQPTPTYNDNIAVHKQLESYFHKMHESYFHKKPESYLHKMHESYFHKKPES